jgi:hypothetical protein
MEWITWTRMRYGSAVQVTKLGDKPPYGAGWNPRPATEYEISKAEAALQAAEARMVRREEFRARLDYLDAVCIRSAIECMEPDAHPLDALTPKEWAELRQRICGSA